MFYLLLLGLGFQSSLELEVSIHSDFKMTER